MPKPAQLNRRRFLKASTALAAPLIVPASVLGWNGATPPSERIQLGVIGLGSRGFNLLDAFLGHDECRIVAVCDVDEMHYRDNPWGKGRAYGRGPGKEHVEKGYANAKSGRPAAGVDVCSDFRDVIGRDDIDAVVIATPDHWHALCTLAALKAGKDVYCEKPLTHLFREGQLVYREVAARKAVLQTGSQQRSDKLFRRAVELARNGVLGAIQRFEVGLPPGYQQPQGDSAVTDPPEHLDYDFWCGPSAMLPYMRARHHRWWRGHSAYGGGVLMDWIGHHNDIGHWAIGMDRSGPQLVEAVGWTFPQTDVYDTPHQYEIRCAYPGGITSSISSRNRMGLKLIGEEGWVYVTRGRLEASDPRWIEEDFNPGPERVEVSDDHSQNFLDCVRSRKPCVAPAETAHRSITPGHLGYISQKLARPLTWDPANERVLDDPQANELLQSLHYRSPWALPD